MCCLFGFYDYGGTLSAKQKNRIISALAISSEIRGTDATGIAYRTGTKLCIYKRPFPARWMRFRLPAEVKAVFSSAFDKRLSLCTEKIFQTDGVRPINLWLGVIHRDISSFLCRVWGRFWSICSSVRSLNRAAVSTHDLTFQRRCKSSLTVLNSP